MKKLLNDPYAYASETLEGLCRAHPQYYRFSDERLRFNNPPIAQQEIPTRLLAP